jgi:anti-sigma factor ChrR (cupin superfamily)
MAPSPLEQGVNADFGRIVIEHTAAMPWEPSPSPSVWRKRLDLTGAAESSRVTSVVRYDAESRFASHAHPDGEEILVLSGVFSDQHGDYPAGSYLLNPEGFLHAPHSKEGCELFVKLRQYPGRKRSQIQIDTHSADWSAEEAPGVQVLPLYAERGHREVMRLLRLAPGTALGQRKNEHGREIFVLEGGFQDEHGAYRAGSWVRYPPGCAHALLSVEGCVMYEKTGHLAELS